MDVGTPETSASSDHYVYGAASLGASEQILIQAEKGIVIQCGTSTIQLAPDKIVLQAETIELSPTKALACSSGGGPSITVSDHVEILSKKFKLFTETGALEVDTDFKAKGTAIKLGYDPAKPTPHPSKPADPEKMPFSCKLSNYLLQPYANKKYHLMVCSDNFDQRYVKAPGKQGSSDGGTTGSALTDV